MSVLMAHTQLGVRRRPTASYDAQGFPVVGSATDTLGPWPGRARERSDGTWAIAVDPEGWPVIQGDFIIEPDTGREWLVVESDLLKNTADPYVDYIRISGHLHTTAGTQPAGGVGDRGV